MKKILLLSLFFLSLFGVNCIASAGYTLTNVPFDGFDLDHVTVSSGDKDILNITLSGNYIIGGQTKFCPNGFTIYNNGDGGMVNGCNGGSFNQPSFPFSIILNSTPWNLYSTDFDYLNPISTGNYIDVSTYSGYFSNINYSFPGDPTRSYSLGLNNNYLNQLYFKLGSNYYLLNQTNLGRLAGCSNYNYIYDNGYGKTILGCEGFTEQFAMVFYKPSTLYIITPSQVNGYNTGSLANAINSISTQTSFESNSILTGATGFLIGCILALLVIVIVVGVLYKVFRKG